MGVSAASVNQTERPSLARQVLPVSDLDSGIVGWESQDDPAMPMNFPESKKWLLLFLLSSINFISPSMFAPAITFMDITFDNTSSVLSSLVVTIFVLGYAVGPVLLAVSLLLIIIV